MDNARDFGQMDSMKSLSDLLGRLSKELAEYSKEYPGLQRLLLAQKLASKQ
ncbi:hypothetical protein M5585_25790 [Serratia ureilytica]